MSNKLLLLFSADICSLNNELQEQLYNEFYRLVYPMVMFMMNDHAAAEDMIQESFLKVIKKPSKYIHEEKIEGWLKTLTRDVTYNYLRKNFNKKFDEVFDDVMSTEYSSQEEKVNPNHSWERVRKQIDALNRKRLRKRRLQWISLFTASILLGAFIFSATPMTSAVSPFFSVFRSLRDNVVTFFYGSEDPVAKGARTPPPPGAIQEPAPAHSSSNSDGVYKSIEVSLNEAKKQARFRIFSPEKVPVRFKLDKTEIQKDQKEVRLVTIHYKENEKSSFYIMQGKIEPDSMISSGLRLGAGDIEEIDLGGLKAFLYDLQDGQTKLEWMKNNVLISIMGDLSKTEIADIAKHMK